MFLFWLIFVPILLWIVYKEFKCAQIRKVLKHTAAKRPLPIVGNVHHIGTSQSDIINSTFEYLKDFNYRNYTLWIGWHYYIIVVEPEDVELILSSTKLLAKAATYDVLHSWIGDGLLTSKGPKWYKHRKMITPAFHFKILQDYYETMKTNSSKFIEKLKIISQGETIFDFQHIVSFFTLDVICDAAMGINVNAMDEPDSEFVAGIHYLCQRLLLRIFHPLKRKNFSYQFFPEYIKVCRTIKYIKDFTYNVIEKRVETRKREETHQANVDGDDVYQKQKMAFLDTLLSSTIDGRPLTHQEIYEEVSTFMFEGHDTISSSLSFTVYLLSRHLGVQEKVFEEQKQIFGDNLKRDATHQELTDMKYLDMVIKESLRLYPSVPAVGRKCEKEFSMNGRLIPEGTELYVLTIALGYNEKVFPDPYRFKPERFEIPAHTPFEYVPFSAGPRNCIGQKFAQLEMKTLISKIVRNFKILPALDKLESKDGYVTTICGPDKAKWPPTHKFDPLLRTLLTLKSENGIYVRLRERP